MMMVSRQRNSLCNGLKESVPKQFLVHAEISPAIAEGGGGGG
jgi:hypothetical protein